jgi:uncharacterized protein
MEQVRFEAGDGVRLEGELRLPDAQARGSAVLCHPDPRAGGSKDHPLLWAVRNDLAVRRLAVLSFNYRGVMGSGGEYGGGMGELEDARAAVGHMLEQARGPVFVCGWSFGASVALRLALQDERVGAVAGLGMPLGDSGLDLPPLPAREVLARFGRPVLLMAGEADPFCPIPDLKSLGRALPASEVAVVRGTDHFFWHREKEAARLVGEFAERALFGATG